MNSPMQKTSAEATIRKVGIVDVTFGKGVTVVEPVNLYGCTDRRRQLYRPVC